MQEIIDKTKDEGQAWACPLILQNKLNKEAT